MKYNISFKGELNVDEDSKDEKQFKDTISKVNIDDFDLATLANKIINNFGKKDDDRKN